MKYRVLTTFTYDEFIEVEAENESEARQIVRNNGVELITGEIGYLPIYLEVGSIGKVEEVEE